MIKYNELQSETLLINKYINTPLIFFDLETTGVDVVNDEIVSATFIKVDPMSECQLVLELLCRTNKPIPKEASDVHGITNDMVRFEPLFADYINNVTNFIDNCDLAGFNSNNFDVPFLINQIQKVNKDFQLERSVKLIDVSNIYRQQFTRTLSDAYKIYTNATMENAHDATADVKATITIFEKQLEIIEKENEIITIDKLDLLSNYNRLRADFGGKLYYNDNNELCFNFGKYKDKAVQSAIDYALWSLKQDFPKDYKSLIRNELQLAEF